MSYLETQLQSLDILYIPLSVEMVWLSDGVACRSTQQVFTDVSMTAQLSHFVAVVSTLRGNWDKREAHQSPWDRTRKCSRDILG